MYWRDCDGITQPIALTQTPLLRPPTACSLRAVAAAFNMFLALFPILLVALGLVSSSLRGKSGQELAVRLSESLPPGSWQLVSELLSQREVNAWQWVFLGWVGTLLVGSQVMELTMAGIQLI
jgi:uncharacterized BrkB/YihY/UPF0761 family membrane protein